MALRHGQSLNGLGGGPGFSAAAPDHGPKPRLLRRQDDDRVAQSSSEHSLNQSPARTLKERQENYSKYREELGLGEGLGPGRGPGRGSYGGRGGYGSGPRGGGMEGGMGMGMGRGGGRKAVFRDKDRDLSDPDYRRGMGRWEQSTGQCWWHAERWGRVHVLTGGIFRSYCGRP